MRKLLFALGVLIMIAVCLFPFVVFGQEATPEPTPDAAQVITDGGFVISQFLAGALTGTLIGGGSVLLALLGVVRFVGGNPALKLAIERLYMSAPAETRAGVRAGVVAAKETFDLADELTDGRLGIVDTVEVPKAK